jgi:hypothetical protein
MHQIEGELNALHRCHQRVGAQAIAGGHIHLPEPGPSLEPRGIACQAADCESSLQQTWHQPPADVPGRASDENCSRRGNEVRAHAKQPEASAALVNLGWRNVAGC